MFPSATLLAWATVGNSMHRRGITGVTDGKLGSMSRLFNDLSSQFVSSCFLTAVFLFLSASLQTAALIVVGEIGGLTVSNDTLFLPLQGAG
jgi:hypothetical protein